MPKNERSVGIATTESLFGSRAAAIENLPQKFVIESKVVSNMHFKIGIEITAKEIKRSYAYVERLFRLFKPIKNFEIPLCHDDPIVVIYDDKGMHIYGKIVRSKAGSLRAAHLARRGGKPREFTTDEIIDQLSLYIIQAQNSGRTVEFEEATKFIRESLGFAEMTEERRRAAYSRAKARLEMTINTTSRMISDSQLSFIFEIMTNGRYPDDTRNIWDLFGGRLAFSESGRLLAMAVSVEKRG